MISKRQTLLEVEVCGEEEYVDKDERPRSASQCTRRLSKGFTCHSLGSTRSLGGEAVSIVVLAIYYSTLMICRLPLHFV